MITDAERDAIDELLSEHSEQVLDVSMWLVSVISDAEDDWAVKVYRGWHGVGFTHSSAGYVCAVFPREDGVVVGFERGAELADPYGLLRGNGATLRYLDVPDAGQPEKSVILEYVYAAIDLAAHERGSRR